MEAAAMALPIVTTDIRGCREVVLHDRTGYLVPVRSAPALADAIEALARDPARRHALGQAGRQHILQNFDSRLVLERLRAFYTGLDSRLPRHRS
jgi:glycosyltransferase involved in cell wall biosynthesis